MMCPKCDGKVQVIDSVNTKYNEVYRRRKCTACGYMFYTSECFIFPDTEFMNTWYDSYRRHKKKGEEK